MVERSLSMYNYVSIEGIAPLASEIADRGFGLHELCPTFKSIGSKGFERIVCKHSTPDEALLLPLIGARAKNAR